jgi:hypothetical protein
MKEIQLTQGQFALVDDIDYKHFNQWKWHAQKKGSTYYAVRTEGSVFKKRFIMHREIVNAPKGMDVDHHNGNGLDNRRANLRICTRAQNLSNRYNKNVSGYKGVVWQEHARKYKAQITRNSKVAHLGYFDNPIEAAQAYDRAAKEYFGEFAKTNF